MLALYHVHPNGGLTIPVSGSIGHRIRITLNVRRNALGITRARSKSNTAGALYRLLP